MRGLVPTSRCTPSCKEERHQAANDPTRIRDVGFISILACGGRTPCECRKVCLANLYSIPCETLLLGISAVLFSKREGYSSLMKAAIPERGSSFSRRKVSS